MVKTLNNILSLVNGSSEEMRTVSLWGKLWNDRGKAVLYILYSGIMAGIVQRVELRATSVSEHLPPFHIINITGHCIKCQCLVLSRTATVALNSTYTRASEHTTDHDLKSEHCDLLRRARKKTVLYDWSICFPE